MALGASSQDARGKRVALVIGNTNYQYGEPLPNAKSDAEAIAQMFERLEFGSVTPHLDLDKSGLDRALKRFTADAGRADMAIIYFAGHGMELDGENYLLPVDAELDNVSNLGFESIRLSDIMRAVESASLLRFVVLDACRDNPFRGRIRGLEASRSIGSGGLARVEPPGNTIVAYAARHGRKAKDGPKGKNSPFAAALLSRLETPNTDIRFILGHIRDDVMAATERQQEPCVYGSLGGEEIQLKRVLSAPPAPLTAGEEADLQRALKEELDWERAQRLNSVEGFESFSAKWPSSRFAEQMPEKIEDARILQETIDWERAQHTNTNAAIEAFCARWPSGFFSKEAGEKLQKRKEAEQSEAHAIALKAAPHKTKPYLNDPQPLLAYLAKFPDHKNAPDISNQLRLIERSLAEEFEKQTDKGLAQDYLKKFPDGAASAAAKQFVDGAGDDRMWIKVLGTTDEALTTSERVKAIERYLTDWPDGRHAVEAKSRLESLKRRQKTVDVTAGTFGVGVLLGMAALMIMTAIWVVPQVWNSLPGSWQEAREMLAKAVAPDPKPASVEPHIFREIVKPVRTETTPIETVVPPVGATATPASDDRRLIIKPPPYGTGALDYLNKNPVDVATPPNLHNDLPLRLNSEAMRNALYPTSQAPGETTDQYMSRRSRALMKDWKPGLTTTPNAPAPATRPSAASPVGTAIDPEANWATPSMDVPPANAPVTTAPATPAPGPTN